MMRSLPLKPSPFLKLCMLFLLLISLVAALFAITVWSFERAIGDYDISLQSELVAHDFERDYKNIFGRLSEFPNSFGRETNRETLVELYSHYQNTMTELETLLSQAEGIGNEGEGRAKFHQLQRQLKQYGVNQFTASRHKLKLRKRLEEIQSDVRAILTSIYENLSDQYLLNINQNRDIAISYFKKSLKFSTDLNEGIGKVLQQTSPSPQEIAILQTFFEDIENRSIELVSQEAMVSDNNIRKLHDLVGTKGGAKNLVARYLDAVLSEQRLENVGGRLIEKLTYASGDFIIEKGSYKFSFDKIVDEVSVLIIVILLVFVLLSIFIIRFVFKNYIYDVQLCVDQFMMHFARYLRQDEVHEKHRFSLSLIRKLMGQIRDAIADSLKENRELKTRLKVGVDWTWRTNSELLFEKIETADIGEGASSGLSGRYLIDLLAESKYDVTATDAIESIENTKAFKNTVVTLRIPGEPRRFIKLSGCPSFDENNTFIGYYGTANDVTSDVISMRRMDAANDVLPGAFALWDENECLIQCNKEFHKIFSILGNLVKPGIKFSAFLDGLVKNGWCEGDKVYFASRLDYWKNPQGIFSEVSCDGRLLEVRESITADGLHVSLIMDVSERAKIVEMLQQTKHEAEQANIAKSRFLAAASHDLRQPLHALGMFISALAERRRRAAGGLEQGEATIISNMEQSYEALGSLLNNLLDISKLDAGVVRPDIETFNLDAVLSSVVEGLRIDGMDRHIQVKYVPSTALVTTDKGLLEKMVFQILQNAILYSSPGTVLVGCRRRGAGLDIEVWDNGPGIPEAERSAIFREFHQLGNPSRNRRLGLGVGLAIVAKTAEILKMKVSLRTGISSSSVFVIHIPVISNIEIIKKLNEETLSPPLKQKSMVLVIDDQPDVIEGMRELIEGWGYPVIATLNTEDAIEECRSRHVEPDIIFADFRLNEVMNGAQVLKMLGELFAKKPASVLITGENEPETLKVARESGYLLLHKPLKPLKLKQILRSVDAGNFKGG